MSSHAAQFLSVLFRDKTESEYIELLGLNYKFNPPAATQAFVRTTEEAVKFVQSNYDVLDLYAAPAPRVRPAAGKSNVLTTDWLWADMDMAGLDTHKDFWRALPPTMVVRSGSGGLHLYWRLSSRIQAEVAEQLNLQMVKLFGADRPSAEYSHKLRIPGTFNRKYPDRGPLNVTLDLAQSNLDVKYDVADITGYFMLLSIPRIGERVRTNIIAPRKPRTGSMSEFDWAVVKSLVTPSYTGMDNGLSDQFILDVYYHTPWGNRSAIGEKEKGPGYLAEYTIPKARAAIEQAGTETAGSRFHVANNELCYDGMPIASFWIEPHAVVRTEDATEDTLMCTIHTAARSYTNMAMPRAAFMGQRAINQALPHLSLSWNGNNDAPVRAYMLALWQQVLDQNLPELQGTKVAGRFGDYFVAPDVVMDRNGPVPEGEEPVFYVPSNRHTPRLDYTFGDPSPVVSKLDELIGNVNHPSVIWPLFGWLLAAPRKESLSQRGVHFPIAHVYGQHGAGKSQLFERILLPLAGIADPKTFGVGDMKSLFRLNVLLSSTNAIPMVFDEFRLSNVPPQALEALRSLYDRSDSLRGRADQSLEVYTLTAPVALTGEDKIEDPALMERCIIVNPQKADIAERGRDGQPTLANRSFKQLAQLPLARFAGPYTRYCLGTADRYDEAYALTTAAFPMMIGDRLRNNIAVTLVGLLSYAAYLHDELGMVPRTNFDAAFVNQVYMPAVQQVINLKLGYSPSACDEFIMDVLNYCMSRPDHQDFTWQWEGSSRSVYLNVSTAHNWWTTYRRQQGRAGLGQQAILNQLRGKSRVESHAPGDYVLDMSTVRSVGGVRARMTVISLDAALEAGLDVPESLGSEMPDTARMMRLPQPREARA